MDNQEFVIAKKYARAWYNLYGSILNDEQCETVRRVSNLLVADSSIRALVFWLSEVGDMRQDLLVTLMRLLEPISGMQELINVLMNHQRLILLSLVLSHIVALYEKNNNIQNIYVTTAHRISEEQKEEIDKFLAQKFNAHIIPHYNIDERLIAGIKIQGDGVVLENSIDKKLQKTAQLLKG